MPMWKDLAVETGVFILKRINGKWSATVIRNTVKYNKESKIQRRINTQLEEPKAGWENLWENLVKEGVVTLPDGLDVGVLPDPDAFSFTMETKYEGIYRVYSYYSGYKEIKEARHMAEIVNIISNEFNLEDF
jgi:hypothetical protein